MKLRFPHKYFRPSPEYKVAVVLPIPEKKEDEVKESAEAPTPKKAKNKKTKKSTDMFNEQIEAAEAIVMNMEPEVKVVKKDRGLIERTESSKIILTEDNRQVLND